MQASSRYFLLVITAIAAIIVAYLGFRYFHYKRFVAAYQTIPYELKLGQFYLDFARFPSSAEEFREFVRSDSLYSWKIETTGLLVRFDSLREYFLLYSPGFDGDDDNLEKTYDPAELDFASSLFTDGDVVLQVRNVTDFLFVLQNKTVCLKRDKPDSALKPIKHKLWGLAQCYADTLSEISNADTLFIPANSSSQYGIGWIEFRKRNGAVTLRIFSELDSLLIKKAEKDLLLEANRRRILEDVDDSVIGFTIDFLGPKICMDSLPVGSPGDSR